MKITFLGTGTSLGVPVIGCSCTVCTSISPRDQRLRASILIETGTQKFLVDAGPDFRQQLLRENVKELDAILITHEHHDHIGGLDDVRSFNFLQNKAIDVYASPWVLDAIRKCFDYAFADEKYPGAPDIQLHSIENHDFQIGQSHIQPVQLYHSSMPVFGYRMGDMAYLTDLSEIPEEELEKLNGLKVVILAALRKKIHHSHMNLDQALALLERIKPETAYLTHISHLMGLYDDMEKELPENVHFAYDGLKIEI